MTQDHYFREELAYLREQGKVFSETYPQLSRFLQSRSYDPDVERLLEGFAFLTARLRAKADDEFPELTHSILNMLWPNYLRPIPSCTVIALTPENDLNCAHRVKKGAQFDSKKVELTTCHYSSCRDVMLYPIVCERVFCEHTREASIVSVSLKNVGKTPLTALNIDALRFYLGGDKSSSQMLYLWLNHYLERISITVNDMQFWLPKQALSRVGFNKEDALLPYPQNVSDGYRLLQEYLTFPEAFHFFDVNDIAQALPASDALHFDLHFHFNKTLPSDVVVSEEQFQLHCVPAINLFAHDADPIALTGKQTEYLVTPSSRHPSHYEVFSIDSVTGWQDKTQYNQKVRGKPRQYSAFESFYHEIERVRERRSLYYRSRVKNSLRGDGFDTFISFVRSDETTAFEVDEAVSLSLMCSNRQLPLALGIGDISKPTQTSPSFASFRNIMAPTQSLRPVLDGSLLWTLISNMSLNYLSLLSVDALKSVLCAYDFKALVDRQAERVAKKRMSGIVGIDTQPVDRLVHGYPVRGLQSVLTLDPQGFASEGDLYLFGTILSHFFSLYASINSFHELTVINEQNQEEYSWDMLIGTQPLI
ncbi:type VI secretion system baseplate subunit TssF [Vibrio parahaemolyticus]|uniref:type VI secretion system baseplate subunit TssF n=1 Tax=Vibrio parahaemolyticus TaxID=670 RepID=UPI00146F239D|nr:type VI secretion system baseplate subunit TssF [Vibrio parahaemolyticus]MDF5022335.1 type VI secretion system baseplate subunit TssF [Vibrio parahaemolyticus]MDF5041589.1 type VI secretion system baseplate subunit TssF [Vibrio parahaemolyticus]MDF5157787.1 type VI secretion system baseplate subunit TssF [Vibrio parahaemolyticus]MDF5161865.1 type VI secretion system baseplate subunit TssF [Vibrio parahaemolyticus]MDF5171382.1 type VI secretion system baseplate subunit TssF [Vibrio parahaemo